MPKGRAGGGAWCAVIGCSNSRGKGWRMFAFPREVERCKKWIENCRRLELMERADTHLGKNYTLCSDHFEDSEFLDPRKKEEGLHNKAVPTKFDFSRPPPKRSRKRSVTTQREPTPKKSTKKMRKGNNTQAAMTTSSTVSATLTSSTVRMLCKPQSSAAAGPAVCPASVTPAACDMLAVEDVPGVEDDITNGDDEDRSVVQYPQRCVPAPGPKEVFARLQACMGQAVEGADEVSWPAVLSEFVEKLERLMADVTQAKADIVANTASIATINSNMHEMKANITANTTNTHTNATNINTNTTNINNNAANIRANKRNIRKNVANITTNTANITTNTTNITTNTSDIAINRAQITTNTSDIPTNTTNITTNTSDIATNATKIATNTTSINSNAANIHTNKGNISENVANITTNTATVTTNTSDIATDVNSRLLTLEADVAVLIQENDDMREKAAKSGKMVSFCASELDREKSESSRSLVFCDVRSEGGGYDAATGVFTCPTAGTYVFTATVGCCVDDGWVTAIIRVGLAGRFWFRGSSTCTGSGSVCVQLEVGEKVWMEPRDDLDKFDCFDACFTGALVQPQR